MSKNFKDEHMMQLQGKDYLPVAPRVVMFRQDHPDYSIVTQTKEVGDAQYVYAEIHAPVGEAGLTRVVATAHKRVRTDAKGPAKLWPLETAETGAIGRALALCGYGTLAGDLDEGEQLADSPVERESGGDNAEVGADSGAKDDQGPDVADLLERVKKAAKRSIGSKDSPGPLGREAKEFALSRPAGDADRQAVIDAVKARRDELGLD